MAVGKGELVDRVTSATKLPKSQVSRTLDAVLDEVQSALKKGESVTLRGFGSFSTRKQAARKGRNPRTGQEISIPARTAIGFRASKPSGRARGK